MPQRCGRRSADRLDDVGQGPRLRAIGGERHAIALLAIARDAQYPGLAGAKDHRVAPRRGGQQDMAGGERRMAAQRDLGRRGEPAQLVIGLAVLVGTQKGGFGQVIFGRGGATQRVAPPLVERPLLRTERRRGGTKWSSTSRYRWRQ